MPVPRPVECRSVVEAVRRLAPEVIEADLRMLDPHELGFEAGQWVSVPVGPKAVRAYSIASTPASRRRIRLCADVSPDGIGSRWFRSLAPGQEVQFREPAGSFVYRRSDPRRPLLVAEEIGIVPVRSILLHLYETGCGRPVRLIYWARHPGGLLYDAELRRLARRYPDLQYLPVVREAPLEWRGDKGEAAETVDRVVAEVANLAAWVAGGRSTIDGVRRVLVAKGMERHAVRWERFW